LAEARTALHQFNGSVAVLHDDEIQIYPSSSFLDNQEGMQFFETTASDKRAIGIRNNELVYISHDHSDEVFTYNFETGETTKLTDCHDERNREFFGQRIEEAGLVPQRGGNYIAGRIGKQWYKVNDGSFELLEGKPENIKHPSRQIPNSNLRLREGNFFDVNEIVLDRTDSWWGDKNSRVNDGNDFFLTPYTSPSPETFN